MSAVRVGVVVIVFSLVFFLIMFNPVKNIVNNDQQQTYLVSIPESGSPEITLSQGQIVASLFSENQSQTTMQQLQQNALSTVQTIEEKKASLTIQPVLEKINENGIIIDRVNLDKISPFSYITNTDSNTDIQNQKIRISLNIKSDSSFQKLQMTGNLVVFLNNSTVSIFPFVVSGITNEQAESNVKFNNIDYFELSYQSLVEKLNIGTNSLKITVDKIQGSLEGSAFDVTDVLLYKADLDYSQFRIITKNESGNIEKVYPKDSKLVLGSIGSQSIIVRCDPQSNYKWGCGGYIIYPANENIPPYPAPVIKNVNISDELGKSIFHQDSMSGKITISLLRNAKYHVTIDEPKVDYFITTPENVAVLLDYSCVYGLISANYKTGAITLGITCGQP